MRFGCLPLPVPQGPVEKAKHRFVAQAAHDNSPSSTLVPSPDRQTVQKYQK
jgi:hypothetical protein